MGKKKSGHVKTSDKKGDADLYTQIFPDSADSDEEDVGNAQNAVSQKLKPSGLNKGLKKVASGKVNVKARKKVITPMRTDESDDSNDSDEEEFEFEDGDDSEQEEGSEMDVAAEEEEEEAEEQDEDVEEEEESEEDAVPKTALRKQLKDLSFEELEALKQKMGLKEYNEAMFAAKPTSSSRKKIRRKFEKVNKHRPKEISSKARVPKLRQVVQVPKGKTRKDPRFDQACGEYNEQIWNTEYSFIRDIQKTEADQMKKQIRSVDDSRKKKEMRRFIQKVSDKEKSIQSKALLQERLKKEKEENRKRIAEGKKPFFVKKSTKKLTELVDKYEELKASGKLEKYLKKKRKKNAVRDRKTLISK